ncbi:MULTISPECIES: FAD-containing oxidoreductase [Brevundimonas]|jgi:pyruvate/2-oxoglutarate dehydrogenase complex dihydrolipoamide dehydrogenase (E3) component|uniref:FAD-containing oxidoreductase n=1 Tax=Brevundimonas TaxID=41275 RepID=UPI001907B0AB|nr:MULTISPECIES: FAD-containing oxidoreductase [Brevundimonas]MDA0742750.1 FAD-containing oxidoreductase [Pseudomonadota bacterium]MBK1969714.1 FAD-containing oxidoreductase [Brevundimonas diminuta]MBK1976632.1 FAD-containing oxidoreductase [Brevundimonas diminuta]MDA1320895.1 FAD-containing oxidoreductase [Pseudomonadota bacterium]MDM8353562.1 FAD-containing oxidoreductase [Brevundimonas diminuta]
MSETFDAIIIGAGQAGPPLVERLTQGGMKAALIERHLIGGTCVNSGCMPTKALVASARAARVVRGAGAWGVDILGEIAIDMKTIKARADAVTANARNGLEAWLGGLEGCTLVRGHACFVSADTVAVGERRLSAPKIFINVGGRAARPDIPGANDVVLLNNTSILQLDAVPRHLVVVGGSYIGLEFAQMYRRFGAEVTIIEKGARLIAREDPDVSEAIHDLLAAEGVQIRTNAECIRFSNVQGGVEVGVDCASGSPAVVGSHVLLAVGRRPNTDDLGLDQAGVATDERGYVIVDDQLATSAPGVWALGDCNGRGAFTHTAYNDFEIVAANLLDGEARGVSDRIDCYALYIDPPLGRVGLTEAQARKAGRTVKVGKRPMSRVGRAVERGEIQGFMKVVVEVGTGAILGGAILGVEGDEAVHVLVDAMARGATADDVRRIMHIHPTVSELLPTVLGALE